MNKIIRIISETRKGDDFQKRELVIQNYPPITVLLIIATVVLILVFKDNILGFLGDTFLNHSQPKRLSE